MSATSGRSSRWPGRARATCWPQSYPVSMSPTRPFHSWPPPRRAFAGCAGRLFRISFSGELAYEVAVPASQALPYGWPFSRPGKPLGITPYGLDALNTLRIEKGHVTGAELNGNTSAEDLGMQRMLKKHGDFVGRMLSQRSGLCAPERLQLVGVRPADPARRLRNGAHLVVREAEADQPRLHHLLHTVSRTRRLGWPRAAGQRPRADRAAAHRPLLDSRRIPAG